MERQSDLIFKRVLLVIVCCVLPSACSSRESGAGPSIEFKRVPLADKGGTPKLDTIEGRVIGARPGQQIILFAAGFLTPIACVLVMLVSIALALSWFPMPPQNLFDDNLVIVYGIVMTTAIALLGPGALSLDARLFGRREIAIPNTSRPPK